jgi:hypothetical protein
VSYDGTKATNNVNFYVSDTVTAIGSALSTSSYNGGAVAVANNGVFPNQFSVGSFYGSGGGQFNGQIDDIRVYGSYTDSSGVLSASQIEAVRQGAH